MVGTAALVVCVGFAALQGRMVFFPTHDIESTPEAFGLDYEDVRIPVGGDEIDAWLVHAPRPRGTVLFFHGNAGNMSHRGETIRFWNRHGFDLLIVDYRGYGQSTGRPSERHTYEDALAAWTWLTEERGVAPSRIVVHGRSLGGAIAAWLAVERTPAVLIIESTFTSVPDIAKDVMPWVPGKWAVRIKYDTLDRIGRLKCPLLIAHSSGDDVIPYPHGKRLFEAAPEPKTFLELVGPHNGGWVQTAEYEDRLDEFLTEHSFPAAPTAAE